jgi:hypothetical protein
MTPERLSACEAEHFRLYFDGWKDEAELDLDGLEISSASVSTGDWRKTDQVKSPTWDEDLYWSFYAMSTGFGCSISLTASTFTASTLTSPLQPSPLQPSPFQPY